MARLISSLLIISTSLACPAKILERDICSACNPNGQKTTIPPAVGPDMVSMYSDLVQSVQGIHWKRAENQLKGRDNPPICCAVSTDCVLLQGYGIAMCYDKFTTNFALPDGSYGNINNGSYHAKSGQVINLINGTVFNSTQNIYSGNLTAMPNTSTMAIPPVYTASGVGGPIAISDLGQEYYSISTVIGPATVSAVTIVGATLGAVTIGGSVIPATTILGTTIPATTIPAGATAKITDGPTTLVASQSGSVSGSGAKKSEAGNKVQFGIWLLSISIVVGVISIM